jgi:hypothetical protein
VSPSKDGEKLERPKRIDDIERAKEHSKERRDNRKQRKRPHHAIGPERTNARREISAPAISPGRRGDGFGVPNGEQQEG